MHGRAKDKSSEAEKEKKRKEKEAKTYEYKELMKTIFDKRSNSEYDDDALRFMSDLLVSHPDVYTVWNFRKEVLLSYKDTKDEEEMEQIVAGEMRLTEICLRANPKSYCAWYHRLWVLENLPKADLHNELLLCNKYLKLDSRNFHCWDYRRAVAKKLGLSPSEELDYTMLKIEENFSNYSSWHYRSKLLPLIFEDPAGIRPIKEEIHLQELDLVQNAAFTDPNDQSAWLYLRWLLGRLEPKIKISQCFLKNQTLFAIFNRTVSLSEGGITLDYKGKEWSAPNSRKCSPVWVTTLEEINGEEIEILSSNSDSIQKIVLNESNGFQYFEKPQLEMEVSENLSTVLNDQLDSCNQLLELEPESKWTLLTSMVLMQAIDKVKYKDEIYDRIAQLGKYDHQRQNYYKDIKSRWIIESKFEEWEVSDNFDLSNLNLTALYHPQYLCYCDEINLSNNLLSRSLPQLFTLLNCQKLILDGNNLENLKGLPILPNLQVLHLRNNQITTLDALALQLNKLENLKEIDISNNPIENLDQTTLDQLFPGIKVIF